MGDATKVDLAAWDRDFRINVTSMMLMSRHVIPEMRKNGRGSIVNMSSVSGRMIPSSSSLVLRLTALQFLAAIQVFYTPPPRAQSSK